MSWFHRMVEALRRRSAAFHIKGERAEGAASDRFNQAGMTLIEIMVVVAIIGLLMGTVGVVAYGRWQKARVTNAKQVVNNMKQALVHYAMDNKDPCPKDLKELRTQKLIDKDPKDPWGEDLIYKCPGEHDTDSADITSKGPDRKEGTDDDIKSWEL
jgi:general secretion pathway protein G